MSDENTRYTGIVKFYNSGKGFGFIKPDDGSGDVFIGIKELPKGAGTLMPDQRVSYGVKPAPKGPAAKRIELM